MPDESEVEEREFKIWLARTIDWLSKAPQFRDLLVMSQLGGEFDGLGDELTALRIYMRQFLRPGVTLKRFSETVVLSLAAERPTDTMVPKLYEIAKEEWRNSRRNQAKGSARRRNLD